MDQTNVGGRAYAGSDGSSGPEALEFVRFCYRRRRVGWPELYDEMCAVAGRALYQGYGSDELAAIGIGLGLFQMPALAGLAARVVAEDQERRRRSAAAIRASLIDVADAETQDPADESSVVTPPPARRSVDEPETNDVASPVHGAVRLALATGA
jgi:hypothetical protein